MNEDDVRATVSSFGTAVDVRHEGVGESEETPHAAVREAITAEKEGVTREEADDELAQLESLEAEVALGVGLRGRGLKAVGEAAAAAEGRGVQEESTCAGGETEAEASGGVRLGGGGGGRGHWECGEVGMRARGVGEVAEVVEDG